GQLALHGIERRLVGRGTIARSEHAEGVAGKRRRINHRGHAHRDDVDADGLPRQWPALVAHARAGLDAGIGELDRTADAPAVARDEAVDAEDRRGLEALDEALDHLHRLDAGYPKHARRDGADAAQVVGAKTALRHVARD